jgi:competence protein ComEA
MDGLRDWLSGLTRRELLLLSLLGVVAVGGLGLWYVRSLPSPVRIRAGPVAAPSASPPPATVIVHVAGWVRRPGVFELAEGERVIDAIEAAGGPRRGADLAALNLAAVLTDAQQVVVPKRGAVEAPVVPSGTAPSATASPGATLINVNTATPEELETLPGIGEVLAAAIVAYRDEHGPFTSVDQLLDVSGIGEVTLEEIRELVTV